MIKNKNYLNKFVSWKKIVQNIGSKAFCKTIAQLKIPLLQLLFNYLRLPAKIKSMFALREYWKFKFPKFKNVFNDSISISIENLLSKIHNISSNSFIRSIILDLAGEWNYLYNKQELWNAELKTLNFISTNFFVLFEIS